MNRLKSVCKGNLFSCSSPNSSFLSHAGWGIGGGFLLPMQNVRRKILFAQALKLAATLNH